MAVIRNELIVAPIGGLAYNHLVYTRSTPLGLYLELRGSPVAAATASCTLRNGASTTSLTVSTATTGEVTTSIVQADLTAISVTMLGSCTAFWSGTVTDGSTTHRWEYEQPLRVADREFRPTITLARLKRKIPQLSNPAACPPRVDGQSHDETWWTIVMDIVEDCERELDSKSAAGAKLGFLTNPAELFAWMEHKVCAGLYRRMAASDKGQTFFVAEAERLETEAASIWSSMQVTVKDGTESFGGNESRSGVQIQSISGYNYGLVGPGGPL